MTNSNNNNDFKCVLDDSIVNPETFGNLTDLGLTFFAPLCGKNRGAVVFEEGATYGCATFPPNYASLASVDTPFPIKDANAIQLQYDNGNLTSSDVCQLLDLYIQSVYTSSHDTVTDPTACDVGGLTKLTCDRTNLAAKKDPIRAATLAGVLVPAPWATGGKQELSQEEREAFYQPADFQEMLELGLTAVQIPVYTSVFLAKGKKQGKGKKHHHRDLLEDLIQYAQDAELGVILVLVDDTNDDDDDDATIKAVKKAAGFSDDQDIQALVLPKAIGSSPDDLIEAARSQAKHLSLFVSVTETDLPTLAYNEDKHVYASLDVTHTTTVAQVASSTSPEDRSKQFFHEAVACSVRSLVDYVECTANMPVFIGTGFDLAIDDCINADNDQLFKDYGQCGRLEERMTSEWWKVHRQSFAVRQLSQYETGMGWSFAAWKLFNSDGLLDTPASLLSLKDVSAAGLMPSFTDTEAAIPLACLNPPLPDFGLGDDTVSPSLAPPPACDGGWWDFDEEECAYWEPPTPCPTNVVYVNDTSACENLPHLGMLNPMASASNGYQPYHTGAVGMSSLVVGVVLGGLVMTMFQRRGRHHGYFDVPNAVNV
eukprot:CAMPEP_0119016376 /NCGR_PEP_ID=MMETSP1176-20130426/12465_1 /TAXON_ID=265551 /ORGANISM="Synedropsis recta cf, Strain CCMP1620" /LENGTH=595 /DNA_ID=CAMNT_0006969753 /DNA_START=12 /DNA_END=1799 /DNA_ORIENTATION=-